MRRIRTGETALGLAGALACVLVLCLLVPSEPVAAPAKSQRRPNIVQVMTDDQTVESMRVMPRVNALLAAHGVSFRNYFYSYSLCCPSRATWLTGQYAHNNTI